MISFFPDLNVWLALSDSGHMHSQDAWGWLNEARTATLLFSRYTQLGLLRLLTNASIMGKEARSLRDAWAVYDQWTSDPRVRFHPEPRNLEDALREVTAPLASQQASKYIGDCYLLAYAGEAHATLVTFDKALLKLARESNRKAISPASL